MQPFRIDPKLPAHAVKTYQIKSPIETHWRPATCEEVDCAAYLNGWRTTIDESTDLGQGQAFYIRGNRWGEFVETRDPTGTTTFEFGPGHRCFAAKDHKLPVGRPEIYVVRDGDWRGNPRGTQARTHTRPEHWVEDFAEHQQSLADKIKEG